MTGVIKVNELQGRTTANDITVTVGSTATQSLEQGLAKGWLHYDQDTAGVIRDSLNMGSVTDVSAGKFTPNYANNFSNGYYSVSGANGLKHLQIRYGALVGPTTSKIDLNSADGSNADYDYFYNCIAIHGDLA